MEAGHFTRRLAAIPAADVVGYSRLVRADEEATLAALSALHAEVIDSAIAVLPFTNMSGDPDQDYFADGMVEEILTGLARIR